MAGLEERIGYVFRDRSLLSLALTHPSLARAQNNQRMEFLGDALLGMVVAKILYDLYPTEQEGELARRQAALVRGETLTQVARDIRLGEELQIAASEVQAGGRDIASNLEDGLEALIGAMYLDGGIEAVERFAVPRWTALARNTQSPPKDAKTALQEWAQARGLPVPTYQVVDSTGPAHSPVFTIEVSVQGYEGAQAQAASKRAAEQLAAAVLLARLQHD
jgi:ribonuclease III